MAEQREQEIMVRKTFKGARDPQTEVMITVKGTPSGECKCNWKLIKIMPAPEWLENPICSGCGKPAVPSKFYVGGMAVMVQLDDKTPEPYCDECRPNITRKCPSACRHVFLERTRRPDEEMDNMRWNDKIEWSVTGERWYSVRYENIKGYLPYATKEPEEVNTKFRDFMNLLVTGKTIKAKGRYSKETKTLQINVSSFT